MSITMSETERWLSIVGAEFYDGSQSMAHDVRLYRMVRRLRSAINTALDMRSSDPKIARVLSAALDFEGRATP